MRTFGLSVIGMVLCALFGCVDSHRHAEVSPTTSSVTPFLMFQDGRAEEAMRFYISTFPDSQVVSVKRHGTNGAAPQGQIELAAFEILGQRVHCSDSPPVHDFTFTPSMSLYIECSGEKELDDFVRQLSDGGELMMPPGNYDFSQKFAFLKDRFGVSWQVNLPHPNSTD